MRKLVLIGLPLLTLFVFAAKSRMQCVVEGVRIDTPSGPRAVEDLELGDVVWAIDERGATSTGIVTAIRRGHTLRHLRLHLDSGGELSVTPSHPIFVDGDWIEAGRVALDNRLAGRSGALGLTRIETTLAWKAVYDVSVEPHENFFANGVLVHNKTPDVSPSQAVSDTRNVISGLKTYASSNCGYFPASLTDATRGDGTPIGIPGYPDEAPELLGEDLARASPYLKSSYRRTYQGFGRPESIPPECDPNSVLAFCYSSVPIVPFRVTWSDRFPRLADLLDFQNRSFVGTSEGSIYVDKEGRELACLEGRPPDFARPLE